MEIEETYFNMLKVKYDKLTANIFKRFSSRIKYKDIHSLILNIILEVLARAVRQEKEIKGIQIGKEGNYLQMTNLKTLKNKQKNPINSTVNWQIVRYIN